MIIAALPFCPADQGEGRDRGRDLGLAYNELFSRLRPGDWAMLYDHDMALVGPWVQEQIERCVRQAEDHPELRIGCFTMVMNRALIRSRWQVARGVQVGNDRLSYHEQQADQRWAVNGRMVYRDVTDHRKEDGGNPLTGLMLLSQKTWQRVGGFRRGFRFCDWDMHGRVAAAGLRVWLVESFYVYHGKSGKFPPS